MSHVVAIKLEVSDIDVLAAAVESLGCTFHRDQKQHRYWSGKMSPCEHAISVPGTRYQIGVIKAKDASGKETGGMTLAYDNYDGVTDKKLGRRLQSLNEDYVRRLAKKKLARKGFRFREKRLDDGRLQLVAYK